ncbi:osmotically inducible protein OsmC [Micrococcales bacterium KH10]|nr:osmotically inducible protein OsmC [Micrococcales bacterium KH10]
MVTSKASAQWVGALSDGSGTVHLDSSGAAEFPVNWKARSEGSDALTTPEELIAAAHSSCFAMALSHALEQNGTPPKHIESAAAVDFQPGRGITKSRLTVSAAVPGLTEDEFLKFANEAKSGCPVSAALAGIEITLDATFVAE